MFTGLRPLIIAKGPRPWLCSLTAWQVRSALHDPLQGCCGHGEGCRFGESARDLLSLKNTSTKLRSLEIRHAHEHGSHQPVGSGDRAD